MLSDSLLPEQDGAFRGQLDRDSYDHKYGKEHDERKHAPHDVRRSF